MAAPLSPTMTLREFENGYWYLEELKMFAGRIGIPAAKKLRKDELEKAIVAFLRTGKAALPTKRSLRKTGVKDVARGLDLKLRIENYTSNRETKDFIVEQARLMAPEVREKSGVWYRLNRWREEQITSGRHPTYGDLVRQYIALNRMERFEKIPHGRYINFVAAFLAAESGRRAQKPSPPGQSSSSSTSPRTIRLGSRLEPSARQSAGDIGGSLQLRHPVHNHPNARARRGRRLTHQDPLAIACDVVVRAHVNETGNRLSHERPSRADTDILIGQGQLGRLDAAGRSRVDELRPIGPAWVRAAAIRDLFPRRTARKSLDEHIETIRLIRGVSEPLSVR